MVDGQVGDLERLSQILTPFIQYLKFFVADRHDGSLHGGPVGRDGGFIFRSLSLVEDEATAMERPRVLLTVSQADKLTIRNTEKTHRLLQLWR